jgi:hypothetical protein
VPPIPSYATYRYAKSASRLLHTLRDLLDCNNELSPNLINAIHQLHSIFTPLQSHSHVEPCRWRNGAAHEVYERLSVLHKTSSRSLHAVGPAKIAGSQNSRLWIRGHLNPIQRERWSVMNIESNVLVIYYLGMQDKSNASKYRPKSQSSSHHVCCRGIVWSIGIVMRTSLIH